MKGKIDLNITGYPSDDKVQKQGDRVKFGALLKYRGTEIPDNLAL